MRKSWPERLTWALLASILTSSPALVFPQPANIYSFSGDADLGVHYTTFISSGQHYIGARGDTVYVVTSNGWTWCQKSTDGGQTFGSPVRVNSTAAGYNPSMRVDTAGIVYVAYQDDNADIRFTKSTDGGESFTPAVKVNDDTIPAVGQEKPSIAVNNRRQLFIAWRDQRTAPGQPHKAIFATASYDGGQTFTPNVQINDSLTPIGVGLDIGGTDEGYVYVAWHSYYDTLYVSRSNDSGISYRERISVSFAAYNLSLAVIDTIVGVVWDFVGNAALRFSVSHDRGQTFSPSIIVDNSGYPQLPSLIWKEGLFYVAWRATHRRTPFGPELDHIWFSYSQDCGKAFAPFADAVPDDTNFVSHSRPSVCVNESERAFVAWRDPRRDPVFGENWHTFVAVGNPAYQKGDLNLDGFLNVTDVVLELNAVFLGQPFPAPLESADGNCDGQLRPADVALILNAVFLGTSFPCT